MANISDVFIDQRIPQNMGISFLHDNINYENNIHNSSERT